MFKNILILALSIFAFQGLYSQSFEIEDLAVDHNATQGESYSTKFIISHQERHCTSISEVNCAMTEFAITIESYLDHCFDELIHVNYDYEILDNTLVIYVENIVDASNQHLKVACFAPNYVSKTLYITLEEANSINKVIIKNI